MEKREQILKAAGKVKRIAEAAKGAFVARDEAIDALACGVVAGEHAIMLGPPGTAKSALVRYWADAMGLDFFRRVLNPDTTREDLVGPLDPAGLRESPARWDRCWTGLAKADFALLDEVGKASSQVLNMLLDALEERRVTSGDVDRSIPLHLAVAASNETLGEDLEAVWDRFTIRLVVGYLDRSEDMVRMFRDSNQPAPRVPVYREELEMLREQVRAMAAEPSDEVLAALIQMWGSIADVTPTPVSDRRWKRVLVVAAAQALLAGRLAIEPMDLAVARWIIWSDPADIEAIADFVTGILDAEIEEIRMVAGLLDELQREAASVATLQDRGKILYRAMQLQKRIPAQSVREEWQRLRKAVADVIEWVQEGDEG